MQGIRAISGRRRGSRGGTESDFGIPEPDFPASGNRERNRDEQGTLWTEQGKEAGGGLPREVGKPRGERRSHDRASLRG